MAVLCVGNGYPGPKPLLLLLTWSYPFPFSLVSYHAAPLARDFLFLVLALAGVVYSGCVSVFVSVLVAFVAKCAFNMMNDRTNGLNQCTELMARFLLAKAH